MARLTGKSADLLSCEDVRQKLRVKGRGAQELREIPLNAIVGSVGRYTDLASFLPKHDSDESRWSGVKKAVSIEVYQIGEIFLVVDGNHRCRQDDSQMRVGPKSL